MSDAPIPIYKSSPFDISKGDLTPYAVPFMFISLAPVATFIAGTGLFSTGMPAAARALGIRSDRTIVALAGIYFFVTFPIGGGLSCLGQTMGPAGKYSNKEPRFAQRMLTGLGSRLMATHHNLMETMPVWSLAALLVQVLEPTSTQLTSLLALHVPLKTTLYPLGYITGVDSLRSVSHIVAISSLLPVFWKLARVN
ncbi:hypothetical protein RQP46_000970 [Phenoliferia psychrophenolica]